jgi:hypothetical protein
MERGKMESKKSMGDLEAFFTERLAEHYGVEPEEVTSEFLEIVEHELEYNLRPRGENGYLRFLTHREIDERRRRVEKLLP